MKIEDMQTLPEFFGVKVAESIWVEGVEMKKINLLHGDCLELMKDIGNKKEEVNEKD